MIRSVVTSRHSHKTEIEDVVTQLDLETGGVEGFIFHNLDSLEKFVHVKLDLTKNSGSNFHK